MKVGMNNVAYNSARFIGVVDGADSSRVCAGGDSVFSVMVKLLTRLELAPEGTLGYIAEAETGDIIQRHRKAEML